MGGGDVCVFAWRARAPLEAPRSLAAAEEVQKVGEQKEAIGWVWVRAIPPKGAGKGGVVCVRLRASRRTKTRGQKTEKQGLVAFGDNYKKEKNRAHWLLGGPPKSANRSFLGGAPFFSLLLGKLGGCR
jgi:hypothetical protein